MINAILLEEYSILESSFFVNNNFSNESKNYSSVFNSINLKEKSFNWKYPRKIVKYNQQDELLFYWSEVEKELLPIQNEYSSIFEARYEKYLVKKDAIITQIEPVTWYEIYFPTYKNCIMFISKDSQLYLSKNKTSMKLDIKGFKSIIKLLPLKEGVILMGFDQENSDIIYKAILVHPLQQPVDIFLEEEYIDRAKNDIIQNLIFIWSSKEYPFLMAYNKIKKTHCIFNYKYFLDSVSPLLKIRLLWEEKYVNEENKYAEMAFIARTLLENKYVIIYHIPSIRELRFTFISIKLFKSILEKKTFESFLLDEEINSDIVKGVKSVVPLSFGTKSKNNYFLSINSLFGLNFQKSNKLFGKYEIENIPIFSLMLLDSGQLALYSGSSFISNVLIKLKNLDKFRILELSAGVDNRFDALIEFSKNQQENFLKMGVRCCLNLLPNDLLVQIVMKLLFSISNLSFSTYLLNKILNSNPKMQWNTLCNIILGKDEKQNASIDEKISVNTTNESMDSPISNGVYKKIKLFSDKNENLFINKTSDWPQVVSFWTNYIKNYNISPFDRKEFCSLISKKIIPDEFLKSETFCDNPNNKYFSQVKFKIDSKTMLLLHGLFEEMNLCPLFDMNGTSVERLKKDILIPMAKNLNLISYYDYYQSLNYNFNSGDKFAEYIKDVNDSDSPPILIDKLLAYSNYSKLNIIDEYYQLVENYFPLQFFTLNLFNLFKKKTDKRQILSFICSSGIRCEVLPMLNPILSFIIEKFLKNYSDLGPGIDLSDEEYILLDRFDLVNSAKLLENSNVINPSSKKSNNSDNLAATVLPHGRNTVDDQKSMLENLQIYYNEKMDPSRIIIYEKETILEKWKNNLFEYSNLSYSELSFNWCFQIFSFDTRFCSALELLSLQNPPHILLQRSSGAYPIDEESWDEFQRQRISDAVQLVFTGFLGRAACTMGGSSLDIFLKNLSRPNFVSKVYEVASNSLINIDNERFKELCLDISIWNDFYTGILEALKFRQPDLDVLKPTFDSYKKNWIFDQMKRFSSSEDIPFQSGFLFGLSVNGFLNSGDSNTPTNFPLIFQPSEIYQILENDGQSIKTSAILLGTAVAALKTQNKILLRLYLMHIPSILPNIYTKSLQISNISQYSAILSVGLLFAQSRNRQIIEILFSEFLRSISELDDQASINPSMYSISVGIALGMVVQPTENSTDFNMTNIEENLTSILLSCISGDKILKFLSNLASGPNLEHYTDYSGLKKFKNSDLLKFIHNEDTERENYSKLNSTHTSNHINFSNSSKSYCSKIVDSTILGIPAAISLSIMHIKSKNNSISCLIPIPYNKPEELVNHRPETLIFMSMSKIVIEWKDDCIPNKEFICSQIPTYLWYLPTDKTFPFPIIDKKSNNVDSELFLDTKLLHCISVGILDWIHCIQARFAILSGVIWGLGIVFAGKRNQELKKVVNLILKYLDEIPLIQMPLCIASTIRDKIICSSQITIDRWSRDLCIRVCLTSISICFSGSGDKGILTQIKYFRAKLLESAQLLWTSSTAISPYSIFSIPPIEHVYSQLMAYNNALGFLFLSSGHVSFDNNDKLISTFLILATHPIYPRDASDISTPGIIFQPLRYLFILAAKYGRKAIIPKLVKKTIDLSENSQKFQSLISKEIITYVPVSVEIKSSMNKTENKIRYYVLPTILPDWNEIKSIKILGNNYCPLNIDLESNRSNHIIKRLFEGQLWVQLKNNSTVCTWNEANYIIRMHKSNIYSSGKSISFYNEVFTRKQTLCNYFSQCLSENDLAGINYLNYNQEINYLYDNFSHTLVLKEDSVSFTNDKYNEKVRNGIIRRKRNNTLLNNCIENIFSNLNQILQDENNYFNFLFSSDLIKIFKILLNFEEDKNIQKLLHTIHQKLCAQINVIVRCLRIYYGLTNAKISSLNERKLLKLFLSLHGMPQTAHFNQVVNKIQSNEKINFLIKEEYNKFDELIAAILSSEFPTLSFFGLKVLKVIIGESYLRFQNVNFQDSEIQKNIELKLSQILSFKFCL